jgi:hypothetical protein
MQDSARCSRSEFFMKPIPPNQLRAGMKLTIISISEFMAHTQRSEVTVVSVTEPIRCGYNDEKYRCGSFKNRGKRKTYYLDLKDDTIVFEGWDLPIRTDSEVLPGNAASGCYKSFSGNACFNLCGNPDTIRDYIDNRNLNPIFNPIEKGKVVHCGGLDVKDDGDGTLLYPDVEIRHAVVDRIRASQPPPSPSQEEPSGTLTGPTSRC